MELWNSYAIEWVEIVKENGKEEEEEEQIKKRNMIKMIIKYNDRHG